MQVFLFFVALILLILPVIDWTASLILYRASKKINHKNIALKERGQMAGVLATASTLSGLIAANRMFHLNIDSIIIIILLSISLILASIPNMYWLTLYLRSRLRK